MDSSLTAASLATGYILGRELNYQVEVHPIGPKQHVPPKPVNISAENIHKEDPAMLPRCPLVYAIITDSSKIGDPSIPDWQPQVSHSMNTLPRPALVPLNLSSISLDVDCQVDTAFVTVQGTWVLHCIKQGHHCDCILAVPMYQQGTVTEVEVEMGGECYSTLLMARKEAANYGIKSKMGGRSNDNIGVYDPELWCLKIPKVNAGANLSIKVLWRQPMVFIDGIYTVLVPFTFPDHMVPPKENVTKITKISCTIDSGTQQDVAIGRFNHPMKEILRVNGRVHLSVDGVEQFPNSDFVASYKVSSEGFLPSCLVQNPSKHSDKGTFYLSIFPSNPQFYQVARRAIVFLLDRSGSMQGQCMHDACQALLFGLSKLNSGDCFNIIAFDHEILSFSPQLQNADDHNISLASNWVMQNCQARGGTDILQPLKEAIQMLQIAGGEISHVFLITDGSVADERSVCHLMQDTVKAWGLSAPRISTFGIGRFCNYYFLKMLAIIGHGINDVAFQPGRIKEQLEKWLIASLSALLTNISLANLELLERCELYPFPVPDLFNGNPVIISGNFHGDFPHSIKVNGSLANGNAWETEVQTMTAKDIDLSKVCARQQLEFLVAQAWLNEDKIAEEKAINLSMSTGIPCEFTQMMAFKTTKEKDKMLLQDKLQSHRIDIRKYTKITALAVVEGLTIGFGSVEATIANLSPFSFAKKELDGMFVDPYGKALYCCDWGLCGDCCCCCLNQERLSCASCLLNCTGYLCQALCAALLVEACFEMCGECCCSALLG